MNVLKDRPQAWKARFSEGFVTARMRAVPLRQGDGAEMKGAFDAPAVWRFARGIDSVAAAGKWLDRTVLDPSCAAFTLRDPQTGRLMGFCALSRWGGDRVELGAWLAPFFWGRGLGRELLEETMRLATDGDGRCALVAEVDPAHDVVVAILQNAGFVPGAEEGLWILGGQEYLSGIVGGEQKGDNL